MKSCPEKDGTQIGTGPNHVSYWDVLQRGHLDNDNFYMFLDLTFWDIGNSWVFENFGG